MSIIWVSHDSLMNDTPAINMTVLIMHFGVTNDKERREIDLQRSPLRAAGCVRATVRMLLQCKILRYRTRLFK